MAEWTVEELELSFDGDIREFFTAQLVNCNGKLYMVVITLIDGVTLLEVDLESRRLVEMPCTGLASLSGKAMTLFIDIDEEVQAVSDGNLIFFSASDCYKRLCSNEIEVDLFREKPRGQMVAFDVRKQDVTIWECDSPRSAGFRRKGRLRLDDNFKWLRCLFQPGLNPFAEV